MLQPITSGNAGKKKGGAAVPRRPLRATVAVTGRSGAAERQLRPPRRPALQQPTPRWGLRAVSPDPSDNEIRQNKGLLGTTHKLSLCTPLRTLLSYRVPPVGRPQSPDVLHAMKLHILILIACVLSACQRKSIDTFRGSYTFVDMSGVEHRGLAEGTSLPDKVMSSSGVITFYDNSGAKLAQANLATGKLDGIVRHWYPDGHLRMEQQYQSGRKHGLLTMFYTNGQRRLQNSFSNDIKDGWFLQWDQDGHETHRLHIRNGMIEPNYKNEDGEQGGSGYPPQGVGSPDP